MGWARLKVEVGLNINVSIDCTPEEARRFMGLPDMAPLHDIYLSKLKETMNDGVSPELLGQMMKSWAPMGEAGFNVWKQMFDKMTSIGTGTGNGGAGTTRG